MDPRTPAALLLATLLAGCQGGLVSADGRPIRPFQDSPAAAPALAPATPVQEPPAARADAATADAAR